MRLRLRAPGAILLTTDAVGGVWRYTIDLATGMVRRGVPATVLVLGPAPSDAQRSEAARAGLRLIETDLPLDWTARDRDELRQAAFSLRRLAETSDAASVHLHAPALAGEERWSVRVVGVVHSCTATWWQAVRGTALPPDFAWRKEATSAGLVVADHVIAPTRAHAEAVRTAYGALPITVIHNGIDRLSWAQDEARLEAGYFTAGRLWDEGKNAAALDRAAAGLGAPVYAAGPTRGPNGATVAITNLNLLGDLSADGMRYAFRRFPVFVSLARYEPFGLSALEAAVSGMRLVLSDIGSFRELWEGAARFVPLGADPVPALQAALADESDDRARRRAERYHLETTVDRTLALHGRVVALA